MCHFQVSDRFGIEDIDGQNRHQHLKAVANTFCLQQPPPTLILPSFFVTKIISPEFVYRKNSFFTKEKFELRSF